MTEGTFKFWTCGSEGTASSEAIVAAVEKAGYGASLKGNDKKTESVSSDELKDTETPKIRNRLIWSVIFLIPLMYISMGHMMWGWILITTAAVRLSELMRAIAERKRHSYELYHRNPKSDQMLRRTRRCPGCNPARPPGRNLQPSGKKRRRENYGYENAFRPGPPNLRLHPSLRPPHEGLSPGHLPFF